MLICSDLDAAKDAVKEIMEDKVFGASGSRVVVEEFLTGPEVSVLAFTDGHCVKPMVSSKDHKRALDNDEGLNTGGMGTISPEPVLHGCDCRGVHEHHLPSHDRSDEEGGETLQKAASTLV